MDKNNLVKTCNNCEPSNDDDVLSHADLVADCLQTPKVQEILREELER